MRTAKTKPSQISNSRSFCADSLWERVGAIEPEKREKNVACVRPIQRKCTLETLEIGDNLRCALTLNLPHVRLPRKDGDCGGLLQKVELQILPARPPSGNVLRTCVVRT